MQCPKPNFSCYHCYNGECLASHWWECAEGYRKEPIGCKGNKNNRYCKNKEEV